MNRNLGYNRSLSASYSRPAEKYIIESTMPLISDTVKRLATARSFIIHTVYIYLETGTELVTYYYHCEHT